MDFDETYNINTKFNLFYMKNRALLFACVGILVCNGLIAKEYHVAKSARIPIPIQLKLRSLQFLKRQWFLMPVIL